MIQPPYTVSQHPNRLRARKSLTSEAMLGTILEQVSKKILEKGRKLTTEDILLPYLDLTYNSIMDSKAS